MTVSIRFSLPARWVRTLPCTTAFEEIGCCHVPTLVPLQEPFAVLSCTPFQGHPSHGEVPSAHQLLVTTSVYPATFIAVQDHPSLTFVVSHDPVCTIPHVQSPLMAIHT